MDTEGTGTWNRTGTRVWRDHIICQLKHRDRNQNAMFQDLILLYSRLLEKTNLTSRILGLTTRRPFPESDSTLRPNDHQTTIGELSYQVIELQQQVKEKQRILEEQNDKLLEAGQRLEGALGVRRALQQRVEEVRGRNLLLKGRCDVLLRRRAEAEARLRGGATTENLRGGTVTENRRLTSGPQSPLPPPSGSTPPPPNLQEPRRPTKAPLSRSSSDSSPRIFSSFKELFQRGRSQSVLSRRDDPVLPVSVCHWARVPVRARQVLEAHNQGINAVQFSCSAALVATGGTDRLLKLWELRAGGLTHQATLDGSTEGITCIDFHRRDSMVLAASYDKSALLWRLDDCLPKATLTGHSRKVTAARFFGLNQAATGSADRSVRVWDLERQACVRHVSVSSYCSDLVSSENSVISGHFDSVIRVWDSRASSCVLELPADGRVTSLDLQADRHLLLSCCRDDVLQLHDLRGRSLTSLSFRAEGFTCGSDSTKAVISPDGRYVAVGSADAAVYVWNVSTGHLETRLTDGHSSSVSSLSWSPSGDFVLSVDRNRLAVLWSDV